MATISSIKLPNNDTYQFKVFSNNIAPILTKTYESTSYYATATDHAHATWYFMKVRPNNWNERWQIKMKVHCFCPNYLSYNSVTQSIISCNLGSVNYCNWNSMSTAALSSISVYPLKEDGFNNELSHAVGFNIQVNTYNDVNYYRTFELEIYQIDNCIIELLNTPVLWEDWPDNTTTNYNNVINLNCSSRGIQENGINSTYATKAESSNHIIASETQPSNQSAGDIWLILQSSDDQN